MAITDRRNKGTRQLLQVDKPGIMHLSCDSQENIAVNEIPLLQILNYLLVQLKGTFHPFLIKVPFPLVPKIQITMLIKLRFF